MAVEKDETIYIPFSPGEITPEWLTAALRLAKVLRDGAVQSLEVLPIEADHGLVSANARLRITYDCDDVELPQSIFVKLAPKEERHPLYFAIGAREADFYTQIAPQSEIRVPICYYSAVDHQKKRYIIILEDLSKARCGDWKTGCSLAQAELAVRRIACFHAQWWEHPSLADLDWLRFFDFSALHEIYDERLSLFLDKAKGELPEEITDASVRLADRFVEIMDGLHYVCPVTVTHHDYQLDNLFFDSSEGNDDLTVVDWQMVNLGRGVLDVGNFLGGNIDPELRRANEMEILKTYHSILVHGGVRDYTFEHCVHDYRLTMVLRLAWAVFRITGASEAARLKLQDIIFPRYFQAFMDLKAWELI